MIREAVEAWRSDVAAVEAGTWDRVSLPVRANGVSRSDLLSWLGRDNLRGVYWLQVPTSAGWVRVFDASAADSWEDLSLGDTVDHGSDGQVGRDANETWSELSASLERLARFRRVASGEEGPRELWKALVPYLGPFCCDRDADYWWAHVAGEEPDGRCGGACQVPSDGMEWAAVCAELDELGGPVRMFEIGRGPRAVRRAQLERRLDQIERGE